MTRHQSRAKAGVEGMSRHYKPLLDSGLLDAARGLRQAGDLASALGRTGREEFVDGLQVGLGGLAQLAEIIIVSIRINLRKVW